MAVPYSSSYDETIAFSDECAQIALNIGAPLTYTIPGTSRQKYTCLFALNSNSNVFISLNGTAITPPAGTVTTTRRLEFRPFKRYVVGGDVLSFVTPDAVAYVGVSLRAIPNPAT